VSDGCIANHARVAWPRARAWTPLDWSNLIKLMISKLKCISRSKIKSQSWTCPLAAHLWLLSFYVLCSCLASIALQLPIAGFHQHAVEALGRIPIQLQCVLDHDFMHHTNCCKVSIEGNAASAQALSAKKLNLICIIDVSRLFHSDNMLAPLGTRVPKHDR
jgi:hypothetical protein